MEYKSKQEAMFGNKTMEHVLVEKEAREKE
jgi:hypothetical protein